jgi:hypothetical protein
MALASLVRTCRSFGREFNLRGALASLKPRCSPGSILFHMLKILLRGVVVGTVVLLVLGVVELIAIYQTPLVISLASVLLLGVGVTIGLVLRTRYRIVAVTTDDLSSGRDGELARPAQSSNQRSPATPS